MEFTPSKNGHLAVRLDDVDAARAELAGNGVQLSGDTFDSGMCKMAFFTAAQERTRAAICLAHPQVAVWAGGRP